MQPETPRSDSAEVTEGGESGSPLDRFLPNSLRTGRKRIARGDEHDGATDAVDEPLEVPRQIGEVGAHVELVLTAAEQAAKQIRREAREAASEIRGEAGRTAARIHEEAEEARRASERERAQVEQYVRETRAAADAQAEQARRDAEAAAATIRADAARKAGGIVAEAERRGQELEDAARRRTEELAQDADDIETRLDDWLGTLRSLTHRLERKLAVDSPGEADDEPESLHEALARPMNPLSEPKEASPGGSDKARAKSPSKSR
jgi:cell division septum initiation protein DivIVA